MRVDCARRLRIRDTVLETINHVLIRHANPLGTLHGGVMLQWMITTATLAAMRLARAPAVLAGMDHIFFLSPVHVGENAILTAWVDYIGRSSMDVTVYVEAENPIKGERRLTTISHMVLVAVNDELRPVPVGVCIEPKGDVEVRLYEAAIERRKQRAGRLERRREAVGDTSPPRALDPRYSAVSMRFAYPEDAIFHNAVYAGKLMYYLDELAGIIGLRYSGGPVVTAAVDATDFYSPILVGEAIEMHAALTYVGRTTMEVTLKAIARREESGEARHTTTSYFTLVALDESGRPRRVPPYEPREEWQRELFEQAKARRARRLELLEALKKSRPLKPL